MSYDLLGERDTPLEDLEPLAEALVALDEEAGRFDLDDGVEIGTDAVQVLVSRSDAAIHIPYRATGDEADAIMDRALAYARVLTEVGGFRMWDPQLDEAAGDPRAAEKLRATSAYVEHMDGRGRRLRTAVVVVLALAALAVLLYLFPANVAGILLATVVFAGLSALRGAIRRS